MAGNPDRSDDQLEHDLAVADDSGERLEPDGPGEPPSGLHRHESYDDLDTETETGTREDEDTGDGPPNEPPPT